MLHLLVPSLPPLLGRHGWSCTHCVWVKVFMKLLARMLEDNAAHAHMKTLMQVCPHHAYVPNLLYMLVCQKCYTVHTPYEGLDS